MHYYNDYGPMMEYGGWGYGLISLGIFVLFLVVIALIASRLVKQHGGSWMVHRDPVDIAKERYAKGEIDKEQFEQIKRDLK